MAKLDWSKANCKQSDPARQEVPLDYGIKPDKKVLGVISRTDVLPLDVLWAMQREVELAAEKWSEQQIINAEAAASFFRAEQTRLNQEAARKREDQRGDKTSG